MEALIMRLLCDVWLGKLYQIYEFTSLEVTEEIYLNGDHGSDVVTIAIRDLEDPDDVWFQMDSQKYDYFPDKLDAVFVRSDGFRIHCYMEVGRSKEKFKSVMDSFDSLLEKIAETGYCKQSDFNFTECQWE